MLIHKQRASFSTISLSGNVQIVLIGYKSKVRKISTNRQDEQRWLALLLDARAMSKVKRFFKGINTEKLELMVAEATQGIHETDQKLACLRQELEVRHTTLFQRKQKKQFCEEAFNRIQIELNTPSNAVNHIQRLSEQVNVYQRYLRDIVATHERQQQANQQESQNLAAQRSVLEKQLAAIDQQLRHVEQSIVAQARVVGTTLSKTYMNKTIASRRFDAVILDEVSIAPLPLVYIAPSLADSSVIETQQESRAILLSQLSDGRGNSLALLRC